MSAELTHVGALQAAEEQAADWVVRLSEGPLTPGEERALQDWRDQDPSHGQLLARLSRTWEEAGGLTHLAGLADVGPAPRRGRRTERGGGGLRLGRPAMAAAAAAAIAAVVLTPLWLQRPAAAPHSTGVAQLKTLRLADGSVVTLGPRSTISVRFSRSERRIRLAGGEAFFEVVHDPARPFLVDAGETIVRDVGTRFDVNRTAQGVRVAVLEGAVAVQRRQALPLAAPRPVAVLRAGQALETASSKAAAEAGGPAVARVTLASEAGAWRSGRLDYDNRALADVVADLNRYYGPGVRLDPDAARLRVTASFRTSEIPAFLGTLSGAVPVKVARQPDGVFRVSSR